jgi:hypothetical protein
MLERNGPDLGSIAFDSLPTTQMCSQVCFNPLLARIRVALAICALAMSLSLAAADASVSRKEAI